MKIGSLPIYKTNFTQANNSTPMAARNQFYTAKDAVSFGNNYHKKKELFNDKWDKIKTSGPDYMNYLIAARRIGIPDECIVTFIVCGLIKADKSVPNKSLNGKFYIDLKDEETAEFLSMLTEKANSGRLKTRNELVQAYKVPEQRFDELVKNGEIVPIGDVNRISKIKDRGKQYLYDIEDPKTKALIEKLAYSKEPGLVEKEADLIEEEIFIEEPKPKKHVREPKKVVEYKPNHVFIEELADYGLYDTDEIYKMLESGVIKGKIEERQEDNKMKVKAWVDLNDTDTKKHLYKIMTSHPNNQTYWKIAYWLKLDKIDDIKELVKNSHLKELKQLYKAAGRCHGHINIEDPVNKEFLEKNKKRKPKNRRTLTFHDNLPGT